MTSLVVIISSVDASVNVMHRQVLSADGAHQVGKITKQFGGMFKELYTNVDNFGLNCTCHVLLLSVLALQKSMT